MSYTLFGQPNPPPGISGHSSLALQTLGTVFKVTKPCQLQRIWYWSDTGQPDTVLPGAVAVFRVADQSVLVENLAPAWSGPAGSGWVWCPLPAALAAGPQYVAAVYDAVTGSWNSYDAHYWDSGAGSGGITNGPLSAPNSAGGNQGLFVFGAGAIGYPTDTFESSNYWIDVQVALSGSSIVPLMGSL